VAKWVVFILGITKLINSSLSVGTSVLNYSKFYYFSLIFAALQTALSIIFNNFLIPIWGINGAAAATLFATLLYYVTLLVLVGALIKTSPFSVAQLKVVTIFFALFALDAVCRFAVSHFLPDNLWLQCAEAVARTILLAALGIFAIYRWQISDEINLLLERFLPHLFKKK
jgi:O-antigen/teichoic acid export membrane protein